MLHILALIFITLVNLLVTFVIYPRGKKNISYRFFAVSALFLSVWSLGDVLMLNVNNAAYAKLGVVMFLVGPMCTTYLLVLFSVYFQNEKTTAKKKKTLKAFTLASLLYVVWTLAYASQIISPEIHKQGNILHVHKTMFAIYSVYIIVQFIVTYLILVQKQRKRVGRERAQIAYCLLGIALSSNLALITNVALPLLGKPEFVWLGPLFTVFYVVSVTLAIVRHRLFDIRTFVIRAAAYAFGVALITIFYSAPAIWLITVILNVSVNKTDFIKLVAIGVVLLVIYRYVRHWFDKLTDKLFFRNDYNIEDVLDKLSDLLVRETDAEHLKSGSRAILLRAIRTNSLEYWLNTSADKDMLKVCKNLFRHITDNVAIVDNLEGEQWVFEKLRDQDVAVVVRLRTTHGELGYLTLGYKASGQGYTLQDKRLLGTAADEIAISMQNALHFEEIQNFNETLQERIERATRELRRTNEKLKALDATKDEFITMASHQLRTPLTSVKGYLSMVLEGDAGALNANQRKLLTQSFASAQRMVYLIADLLNLSRLNTGKFVIELSPVNLAEVVKAEVAQLKETAESRSVNLTYRKPASFPTLLLDDTKVHQVVMNFIDNAIYYTPAGGKIDVELKETATSVEYIVTDTGMGVPRAEQHRLFTKFFRAENARRARPDGTGLGLFMAKKIIAEQGGAIIFDSEEGKGSTFGFRFSKAGHVVAAPAVSEKIKA